MLPRDFYLPVRDLCIKLSGTSSGPWYRMLEDNLSNAMLMVAMCDVLCCTPGQLVDPTYSFDAAAVRKYLLDAGVEIVTPEPVK